MSSTTSRSRSVSQDIIVVRSIRRQRRVAHCGQRSLDVPLAVELGQSIPWLAGRPGTPKGRIDTLTETVRGAVARGLHLADISAPRFAER
jgi:hypothetical protein